MDRTQDTRRVHRVLPPALAVLFAALLAVPAQAQDERYAVLVPIFANSMGGKGNFGKDTAKEFRKLLENYPTHKAVDENDLKDKLKQFGIKEETLSDQNCVPAQQMTVHVNAKLVLCGDWVEESKDNYKVSARFIAPGSDEYVIAPFAASNAKEAAQQILAQFDTYIEGLRVAVYCQDAVGTENWAEAITRCGQALENNPKSKGAAYNLASALWKTGELDRAAEMFHKVLEIDPTYDDAMLALGILAAEQGNTAEATRQFEEYLTFNPGDIAVRLSIATEAAKAGGYEAALTIVEDGMSETTGDDLTALKEFAGAVAMNAALKQMEASGDMSDVGSARPTVERGLRYLEEVYAAKGAETDATALRNMLTAYRLLEQNDKAIEIGRAATEHFPDDPTIWSNYADALNRGKMLPDALAALDQLERIDAQYANLYARRTLWQLEAGNLDAAVAAAQEGLQRQAIDPQQVDQIAKQITSLGYNDKAKANQHAQAASYYDTAEKIAQTAETRAMISFFRGFSVYQLAVEREKPETIETARATLPQFQRAQSLMQAAATYTQTSASLEKTRQDLLAATAQYIEIQDAIIKRGR